MTYDEILSDIEDSKLTLENYFYYYPFKYKNKSFKNMITDGIKSPLLFNKEENSRFYISLCKNLECNNSLYNTTYDYPKFIINPNIRVVKATNRKNFVLINNEPYDDEYLRFLLISSEDIFGIQYNLFNIFRINDDISKKDYLIILRDIINDINDLNKQLFIIDSSNNTQINTNKALSLLYKI